MKRFSFLLYFTVFLFMNGVAQAAPPYPPSSVIEKVTWDFANLKTIKHSGKFSADLWRMTWGPDGEIYTAWGDGYGFSGIDAGLGVARISGGPTNWVGTDVYRQPRGGGYPNGLLSVGGVLYNWYCTGDCGANGPSRLRWSKDLGKSWTTSSWSFERGIFTPVSFVNFGKDYQGARDGFVYMYGGMASWEQPYNPDHEKIYLVRVPTGSITDKTRYEYYSGDQAGNPAWTKNMNERRSVFRDANLANGGNETGLGDMVYNPVIKRYLLSITHGGPGNYGLFDAPEPWGPWTTVAYESGWGGLSNNIQTALLYNFVNKWTSADGLTMWMVFSGFPPDGYHQVKATLKLKQPSVDNTPPGKPEGLKLFAR